MYEMCYRLQALFVLFSLVALISVDGVEEKYGGGAQSSPLSSASKVLVETGIPRLYTYVTRPRGRQHCHHDTWCI
jgi:hypothetical protein